MAASFIAQRAKLRARARAARAGGAGQGGKNTICNLYMNAKLIVRKSVGPFAHWTEIVTNSNFLQLGAQNSNRTAGAAVTEARDGGGQSAGPKSQRKEDGETRADGGRTKDGTRVLASEKNQRAGTAEDNPVSTRTSAEHAAKQTGGEKAEATSHQASRRKQSSEQEETELLAALDRFHFDARATRVMPLLNEFCTLEVNGDLPPWWYAAVTLIKLVALLKDGGAGVRPIAVGNALREYDLDGDNVLSALEAGECLRNYHVVDNVTVAAGVPTWTEPYPYARASDSLDCDAANIADSPASPIGPIAVSFFAAPMAAGVPIVPSFFSSPGNGAPVTAPPWGV